MHLRFIERSIIKPALESGYNYHNMSDHMLQGASLMIPFIDPLAFSTWCYKVFSAEKPFTTPKSNLDFLKSKALFYIQILTFDYLLYYKTTRSIAINVFNALIRFAIFFANSARKDIIHNQVNISLVGAGAFKFISEHTFNFLYKCAE